jgi:hypothetical protein
VLRGLAGACFGLGLARLPIAANAKKQRKKRARFNQYGCLDVGETCSGKDARCSSGICKGKKGRSRCVAHDRGACT